MEEDLKNAEQKFLDSASDTKTYENVQSTIYQSFLSKVETLSPPAKQERPSAVVLGPNGVGKSSLINAMAGQKVTEVGVVDCTTEVSMVFGSATTDFYDVPGCSDIYSYCNLKHIMKIKTKHLILICYTDRAERIINLEKMVAACKVPYLVVRTKIDQVSAEANLKEMETAEKEKITGPLVYVSAHSGEGMDRMKTTAKALSEVQL